MQLTVKQETPGGLCIRIPVPNCLLLNPVSSLLISRQLQRYGITLTYRQLATFFKVIRQCRHRRGDWTLLEVDCASGEHVEIRL